MALGNDVIPELQRLEDERARLPGVHRPDQVVGGPDELPFFGLGRSGHQTTARELEDIARSTAVFRGAISISSQPGRWGRQRAPEALALDVRSPP